MALTQPDQNKLQEKKQVLILVKGALSRILTDYSTAKIYIRVKGNQKINGPFSLTIAILEHSNCLQASLTTDSNIKAELF